MSVSKLKKLLAVLTTGAMAAAGAASLSAVSTEAAATSWKFDLGATAQSGFTSVSASAVYSSSTDYGFSNNTGVKDVTAPGTGTLSDAVQFTDDPANTFNVDLTNGLYRVTVTLGTTNRTSIYMEDSLQIVNMTGNNATDTILVPVTDGQLNIRAAAGKAGYAFTISEIDIDRVSDSLTLPKTIWFCGDSTVCNYYPKDTSVQAGWGQVFDKFIDTSKWQVRDMASSGQYARGFIDSGQFATIEKYGNAGDIYIISIGINDTNKNYTTEAEYVECVTQMAKTALGKGMKVYLVKQQGRASDVTNQPNLKGRWFGSDLDKIGAELNIPVVDLFTPWHEFCMEIGQEETYKYYMTNDDLHPNRQGALKLAEFAAQQIDLSGFDNTAAVIDTTKQYLIRNKNSGLYMTAAKGDNFANVSQKELKNIGDEDVWNFVAGSDGAYYIYSNFSGGKKYLLDLEYGSTENGTNIGLYENTSNDAQLFKLVKAEDGSYVITTLNSKGTACVEVKNASLTEDENIQEWERNGHDCQSWFLDEVNLSEDDDEDAVTADLNGDGKVNVIDLALLKVRLSSDANSRKEIRKADINSDGYTNALDANVLNMFIIKHRDFEGSRVDSGFYYASDATFSRGIFETANAGFRDLSYVNLDNVLGSSLQWTVNVKKTGNYLCTFGVSNGSTVNRQMKIFVNSGSEYWLQDFISTGSWTDWNERGIVLPLSKGTNKITMVSATESGGPNIDYLRTELTDEPIAETYKEPEEVDPPVNESKTIYIAGDSTVQSYRASYAPQQGWGYYLGDLVKNDGYTVSNHAIAGRSSKSFYDNGRLDTILNEIKEGDYLLVQFGINDSAASNAERYAFVDGNVPGAEGSFEYYIAKYIEGAKAKGATPVLVTTVIGLKAYNASTGKFAGSYTNYCDAMKKLGSYYNIPVIDLNSLMVDHYNSIGYDAAYKYHLISAVEGSTDMTHFTETGASAVADLVYKALKSQKII